jgi:arylsulfatase A-like enzyme
VLAGADDLEPLARSSAAVRRVRVGSGFGRDERVALVSTAGSVHGFAVKVPAATRLRTAIGSAWPEGGTLQFRIRVNAAGAKDVETLFDQAAGKAGATAEWQEVDVDLSRWEGDEVRIELVTEAGSEAASAVGAWEMPRLEPRPQEPRSQAPRKEANRPPNVIWISVDTLRADRLGAYGYTRRPTSPHLDAFAREGVRFAWAISQSPWTRPSHRSMLTGLYPGAKAGLRSPLVGVPLRAAGYRTIAMTGAGQMDSSFGFDLGFEIYRVFDWIHDPVAALDWIEARSGAPFFAFLHTYETHEPYSHREMAAGMPAGRIGAEFTKAYFNRIEKRLTGEEKAFVEALYDGDIANPDAKLGALFDALQERGLFDNTIVLVTSDHGEQFWDHGSWGHGQNLYDHQIHVPLVARFPEGLGFGAGRVVEEQVELIDLYPTVLDLAGAPFDWTVQGRSLRPLLAGEPFEPRQAFAEHTNVRPTEQKGLRTARYKFILVQPRKGKVAKGEALELYDLRADPGERQNLAARYPDRAAELRAEVLRRVHGEDPDTDEEVPSAADAELRKQLEALGYIGN